MYRICKQQTQKLSIQQIYNVWKNKGFIKVYSGLLPAVLGSFFSSTIYFGSYERAKKFFKTFPSKYGINLNRWVYWINSSPIINRFSFSRFTDGLDHPSICCRQLLAIYWARLYSFLRMLSNNNSSTWSLVSSFLMNSLFYSIKCCAPKPCYIFKYIAFDKTFSLS